VLVDTESRDEKGDVVAETTSSILFRGEGGFGEAPSPKEEGTDAVSIPKDKPPLTFRIEEATSPEQALHYRLSGDRRRPAPRMPSPPHR
jgi:hypothetical protein